MWRGSGIRTRTPSALCSTHPHSGDTGPEYPCLGRELQVLCGVRREGEKVKGRERGREEGWRREGGGKEEGVRREGEKERRSPTLAYIVLVDSWAIPVKFKCQVTPK